MIDETLSATKPTSKEVDGVALVNVGGAGQNATIGASVIPTTDTYFSVVLECAIGDRWHRLHGFDKYTASYKTGFDVPLGASYRFRHLTGGDVRCILTT
jgi:hypothetical protein